MVALCRLLQGSRSGFYAWLFRPPSTRAVADEVLTAQIRAAFDDDRRFYGAPRTHAELAGAGVHVGRKRSSSMIWQDPVAAVAPDRVDRTSVPTAPNELWVPDVTYVPTVQGWLYLASLADVFGRMVIGWSMASHRTPDLVVDAVTMAVHRRGGHVPGVVHHSTTAVSSGSRGGRNTGPGC